MGHIITFLYLGNIKNVSTLLLKIETNERLSKESKYESLIYQTLKSEIRKKLPYSNSESFKNNYEEKVRFYYLEDKKDRIYKILNNEECKYEIEYFLDGIISIDKKNVDVMTLFNQINNIDSLKKLVYNIDTVSFEQQKNTDQENDEEQNQQINVNVNVNKIEYSDKVIINIKYFDYIKYDFINLDINNDTLKINEDIRFLPNCFSVWEQIRSAVFLVVFESNFSVVETV